VANGYNEGLKIVYVKRFRTQCNVLSVKIYILLEGSLISLKKNYFQIPIIKIPFGPLRDLPIFVILKCLHVKGVPDNLQKKEF